MNWIPNDIEPAPRIGTRLRTEFIKGMGKRDDQFMIILDIDKIFSSEDISMAQGDKNTHPEEETVIQEQV